MRCIACVFFDKVWHLFYESTLQCIKLSFPIGSHNNQTQAVPSYCREIWWKKTTFFSFQPKIHVSTSFSNNTRNGFECNVHFGVPLSSIWLPDILSLNLHGVNVLKIGYIKTTLVHFKGKMCKSVTPYTYFEQTKLTFGCHQIQCIICHLAICLLLFF